MFRSYRLHLARTAFLLAFPLYALAHVQWFSAYSYAERPLPLDEILTPLFAILLAVSTISVAGVVVLDERLTRLPQYATISAWLIQFEHRSDLFLTLGFAPDFFLSVAAFVEFTLGFLSIE